MPVTQPLGAEQHVLQMSGGLSSTEGGVRVSKKVGRKKVALVFGDTLVEDADLYRFLIEGSAFIVGMPLSEVSDLSQRAFALPPPRRKTIDVRKALLANLRADAMERIPQLVWLCEGRTPWQVIFDTRFLSHRADKCSEYLKRRMCDQWRDAHCDRATTIVYVGFGFTEQDRIERSRAKFGKLGWHVEFPMDDAPLLVRNDLMRIWRERGIQPPRLYFQGYPHNNCGGFCFKMGQGQAAKLLRNDPAFYGDNEASEAQFRAQILADASILKDRRGGGPRRPISLQQFRESIQAGESPDLSDVGACSCFDHEDELEVA